MDRVEVLGLAPRLSHTSSPKIERPMGWISSPLDHGIVAPLSWANAECCMVLEA